MSAELILQEKTLYRNDYIASCVAAFSLCSETEENYRKLPKLSLCLLLNQKNPARNNEFSLPTSFIKKQESSLQTIHNELYKQSSISKCYLEQLYTFTEFSINSDHQNLDDIAKENVSTISNIALIDNEESLSFAQLQKTCGSQSQWFKISYEFKNNYYKKNTHISEYILSLSNNEITLTATILQKKNEYELENSVEVSKAQGISPISAQIISYAITRLRGKIEYTDIAFRLLPETFSIKTLQKVYELVLGKSLLDANFRRKILPKLTESVDFTNDNNQSLGHRKAKLYTLNKEQHT